MQLVQVASARLPGEMDREAPGLFTASERIMQDFARFRKLDATVIKDLIQKVLHHPDFDSDQGAAKNGISQ